MRRWILDFDVRLMNNTIAISITLFYSASIRLVNGIITRLSVIAKMFAREQRMIWKRCIFNLLIS